MEGKQTPGGSKRKHDSTHLKISDLCDSPSKKPHKDLAEISRPHRKFKRTEMKKAGKKKLTKSLKKTAMYINWHNPITWDKIIEAAKHTSVGYTMKAGDIWCVLINNDPKLFENIAESTIHCWIDRTGDYPKWSESALRMAEKDYQQGGEGGCISAKPQMYNEV